MKIQVNGEELFELKPWEIKLLQNDLLASQLEDDLKRRLKWVLTHKVEQCFTRFEKEWLARLRNDPLVNSIPTDKEDFVNFVVARPDYHDREMRESTIKNLSKSV